MSRKLNVVSFCTPIQGSLYAEPSTERLSRCANYKIVEFPDRTSGRFYLLERVDDHWQGIGHGSLGVGYPLYHDTLSAAATFLKQHTDRDVELPLPLSEATMGDASFTQAPSETRVMRVDRGDAIALLKAVGFKANVSKFTDAELSAKLSKFPKLDLEEPESKALKTLLEDVLNAAEQEEGIVITDAAEEEEADKEESTAKGGTKTASKTAAKSKKTKGEPESNGNGVHVHKTTRWKELKDPKITKVTPELAKKFRDMASFPRERPLTKSRKEFLAGIITAGEWEGNVWASVEVAETGETYRLNGNGSSTAFAELFESGKEDIEACVTLKQYACETMTDAAALWGTFDPKQSARSKGHLLQAYASGSDKLVKLPSHVVKLAAAGLGFAKYERDYRSRGVADQATLMLDNDAFVVWLSQTLDVKRQDFKHIFRMPVVAAMAATYAVDEKEATAFWESVRDDSDAPKTDPVRVLRNWLLMHNFGAKSENSEKEIAGDREGYVTCLQAWNAWRKKDAKWKPSKYNAKADTPVVS